MFPGREEHKIKEEMMGERGNCAGISEEKDVLIRWILSQVPGKEAEALTWSSGVGGLMRRVGEDGWG